MLDSCLKAPAQTDGLAGMDAAQSMSSHIWAFLMTFLPGPWFFQVIPFLEDSVASVRLRVRDVISRYYLHDASARHSGMHVMASVPMEAELHWFCYRYEINGQVKVLRTLWGWYSAVTVMLEERRDK